MGVCDLRDLVELLDRSGDLHRITVPVESRYELAMISRRVANFSNGGPALMFEKVSGSSIPVLTNLFCSQARIARTLGLSSLDALPGIMSQFLVQGGPETRHVTSPVCRELVAELPDCDGLPVPVVWPGDGRPSHGGRFITIGLVITRKYGGNSHNLGLYRIACFSGTMLGVSWQPGSGGAAHHASWSAAGEPMPVAVVLGTDPALTLAAMTPVPPELDELSLAGALRGSPVTVCRALTSDLVIPASAEFVIEGLADPAETLNEGAFGNYTGDYAGRGQVPLIRVTAVTCRSHPIFPALIAGPPPCESFHLAAAVARFIEPLDRLKMVHAPPWSRFFNGKGAATAHPEKLVWPPEMEELVDRRWREYGFTDDS